MPFKLQVPMLATIVGRRTSGKTTLMKHFLHTLAKAGDIDDVIVMCGTAFTQDWTDVVGAHRVIEDLDQEVLEIILNRLREAKRRGSQKQTLLILDDCLGSMTFTDATWRKIASAGRHYNLSVWVATQHYFAIPPLVRTNSDFVTLQGNIPQRVWKTVNEEFSPEDTWKQLEEKNKKGLANFGAIVVDVKNCECKHIKAKRHRFTIA